MRLEIRLAGEGGQGLILAGVILAEAAIADGLNAVQTQVYGPESRGGASKSEVILSDVDIDYPRVSRPDVLLVMSQEAYQKYLPTLKEGGVLILDSDLVSANKSAPGERAPGGPASGSRTTVRLPITALAREVTGRSVSANIVALGVLAAVTGVISTPALRQAVLQRVPRGTEVANLKALEAGLAAGRGPGGSGG